MEPIWLARTAVDLIHEDQRQQFGGNAGVLNNGGIESALARARNRFEYAGANLFECAASYVFGLAKNHGYQDANKRTAYMTGWTFLRINGFRVRAAPTDIIQLMLDVATDVADESVIAHWLQERATRVE
ncbi:MAG: type II toxin-antitoxin system death-on-curing family toxin [Gemmatimonadaceae bacterium]